MSCVPGIVSSLSGTSAMSLPRLPIQSMRDTSFAGREIAVPAGFVKTAR